MSESVHDHLDRNSVPDLERLRGLFLQIEEPRTSLKPQLTLTVSVTSQGICAARLLPATKTERLRPQQQALSCGSTRSCRDRRAVFLELSPLWSVPTQGLQSCDTENSSCFAQISRRSAPRRGEIRCLQFVCTEKRRDVLWQMYCFMSKSTCTIFRLQLLLVKRKLTV